MLRKLFGLVGKTAPDSIFGKDVIVSNYHGYGIDALNREIVDKKLENLVLATLEKRRPKCEVVVNLTSFPARIHEVHYVLLSLLSQSLLPSRIILWLSREEFPQGMDELPETLIRMIGFGVHIEWCRNLRAYTKLVPALQLYPTFVHVTADDDIFYHRDWLKELYEEFKQHGEGFIYAHRAHRICLNESGLEKYCNWEREISDGVPSFLNLATGVGGVLYPINCLWPLVTDSEKFMEITPANDDLWFWAMAVLNNRNTRVTKNRHRLVYINPERELRLNGEFTLAQENVVNSANDRQLKRIVECFPVILEKLYEAVDKN